MPIVKQVRFVLATLLWIIHLQIFKAQIFYNQSDEITVAVRVCRFCCEEHRLHASANCTVDCALANSLLQWQIDRSALTLPGFVSAHPCVKCRLIHINYMLARLN